MSERQKRLLIVYHSHTGGTLQMAEAAAEGARSEAGAEVLVRQAVNAHASDLLAADGYVFATPENLAAISGMMKDFFDRTYYALLERLNARPYLSLVCAGSDGSNAVRQIERIAAGWRLKAIAEPLIVCTHVSTPEDILKRKQIAPESLARCAELGRTLASGLAMGIF